MTVAPHTVWVNLFVSGGLFEVAAFILERIDARWPSIVNTFAAKE